jgi:hypothetical protein
MAREILSKRNFFDFESPDFINSFVERATLKMEIGNYYPNQGKNFLFARDKYFQQG